MRLAVASWTRVRGTVSYIVSVTQPVSCSFACHVSCKVKYFGKVANVERGFEGETMFFHFRSTVVP